MQSTNRNDVIDAFRGIAIALVIAYHYTVRWTPPQSPVDLYGYSVAFSPLFDLGRYGVHVFFVISGLVITMTVLRSASALDFAVRRFARIMPAFIVASVLTFAVCQLGPAELRSTLLDFVASFTFMPEKFGLDYVDGAYWSLSIEIRFYAWVALSFLFIRNNFWVGLLVPAFLSLFITSGPLSWFLIAGYWPLFLFGMAGWYGIFERKVTPAAILGLAGAVILTFTPQVPSETAFILFWVVLMFAMMIFKSPSIPGLPWLGRISYSLYLIHQNIGVTLVGWLTGVGAPDAVAIALAVAIVVGLSWFLFNWIERPGQKWFMSGYRAVAAFARRPASLSEIEARPTKAESNLPN